MSYLIKGNMWLKQGASLNHEREGTGPWSQVSRFYWGKEKRCSNCFIFFSVLLSFFRLLLSLGERRIDGDSLPFRGSPRRNGDGSIGGSRRRRKTTTFLSVALVVVGRRRETATSLSIGGSLRLSILAIVAAEANRKVKLHACL